MRNMWSDLKGKSTQKLNFVRKTNERFKSTNCQSHQNKEIVSLTFWLMKDVLIAGLRSN